MNKNRPIDGLLRRVRITRDLMSYSWDCIRQWPTLGAKNNKKKELLAKMRFESKDLDQVKQFVGQNLTEHTLDVKGKGFLDCKMEMAQVGSIGMNRLEYGAAVTIKQLEPEDVFLLVAPFTGHVDVVNDGREGIASNQSPLVLAMHHDVHIREIAQSSFISVLRFERAKLETYLRNYLGTELNKSLCFNYKAKRTGEIQAFWQYVDYLWSDASIKHVLTSPLLAKNAEQLLISMLLMYQPHNFTEALKNPLTPITPFYVRRAMEYLKANADQPITIEDLCRETGVSARSLYTGFRNFFDTTPMQFLRRERLNRIHQDLLAANPTTVSVTEVVLNWGFCHFGRLASEYKGIFGELPSHTLRRG